MTRRASEQFVWNETTERQLRACVAGGMLRKTMAVRFGTTPEKITEKIRELGIDPAAKKETA